MIQMRFVKHQQTRTMTVVPLPQLLVGFSQMIRRQVPLFLGKGKSTFLELRVEVPRPSLAPIASSYNESGGETNWIVDSCYVAQYHSLRYLRCRWVRCRWVRLIKNLE